MLLELPARQSDSTKLALQDNANRSNARDQALK